MSTKIPTSGRQGGRMDKGLSELRRGILGIACAVNIHTQGGEARVKPPGFDGPADYRTALGICLLYRIVPSSEVARTDPRYGKVMRRAGMFFEDTPRFRRAKAESSRAATYLVGRKLLAWHGDNYLIRHRAGYLLTDKGIEDGRVNLRQIPLIDQTLEFFGITTPIGGRVPGIPTPEYLDRIRAALDIAEG
jgi:hypothetical protein